MSGADARAERQAREVEIETIKAELLSGLVTGEAFDRRHSEMVEARQDIEKLKLREQAESAAFERQRAQADRERLDHLTSEAAELRQQGAEMAGRIQTAIDALGEVFREADSLVAASRQLEREGDSLQKRLGRTNGGAPLVYGWHQPQEVALALYGLALARLTSAGVAVDSPAAMSARQAARK